MSESLDAVSSVECIADLFVSLNKSLKFSVKLNILTSEHIAVMLKGIDFSSVVSIGLAHRRSCESEVILFASAHCQIVVSGTGFSFDVIQLCGQALVTLNFLLGTSDQLRFLLHF